MTSRERMLKTLNHEEPDRVPFDLNGTLVSGIHHIAYNRLREHLGMKPRSTELFDRVQGLARVHDDMLDRLEVDTRGVLTGSPFGWRTWSSRNRAAVRAMPIVCSSSDSRTPPHRPSMVGRMPILGMAPMSRLMGGFILISVLFISSSLNCRLRISSSL